ncbi:zf-HC2 domain-containing protein [Biomphalaria pfeifferi]|uniref:Zf-HC2 domain-containing protein n=1 Tax=Biomphalaria pfeifferi TaxID=112525 RepID=A0AAD8AN81_BIOPF|nr:zf-HC2 domain-containing protein [Biomphalaria pfeifferi]
MKCEELQFNIAVYLDDILSEEEIAQTDAHLHRCPLCRQKLADYQGVKNNLRVMARPEMPAELLSSVRNAVAAELRPVRKQKSFFSEQMLEWLQMRLMPYSIGVFASVTLGSLLLWNLMTAVYEPNARNEVAETNVSDAPVMLPRTGNSSNDPVISPDQFANSRLSISAESPSVNPQGALVALTKSLVRGDMKDEEVVVIADVFGDGLAQIEEVIEPSNNRLAVQELEKALKKDSAYAPFVPANLDQRAEMVRVVLKIQSVNVKTNLNSVH